jgi:pre-mRNA-splicing factor CWC22
VESKEGIEDRTETNLVNLRRIIYLTIMNALNYEEAVHKLLKIQVSEGQEVRISPGLSSQLHISCTYRLSW